MSLEALAMSSYQFISLDQIDLQHIVDVFNESFVDYEVSIDLSRDAMEEKLLTDRIRLDKSLGAIRDGKLIGFMLTGYDEFEGSTLAYNAGTGVIPAHRRTGIGTDLYRQLFRMFQQDGIEGAILEVLCSNQKAIKLYEASGFSASREFTCIRGTISQREINPKVTIVPQEQPQWDLLTGCWDYSPSWQNSISAVTNSRKISAVQALVDGHIVGYACFNEDSGRILQIAVNKEMRKRGIGTALMSHIAHVCGKELSITNIESNATELLRFFEALGLVEFAKQYEMRISL